MSNHKNTRKVERDDIVTRRIADLMDSAYLAQTHLVKGEGKEAKRIVDEATGAFVNALAPYVRKAHAVHKCELGHLYVSIDIEDDYGVYEATLKAIAYGKE